MLNIRENVLIYLIILNTVCVFCSNHGFDLLAILKYNIYIFKNYASQIDTLRSLKKPTILRGNFLHLYFKYMYLKCKLL